MANNIVMQFRDLGDKASYHYADDSGSEWGLADDEKRMALALFDANPELQQEMREVARGFLWSLELERRK